MRSFSKFCDCRKTEALSTRLHGHIIRMTASCNAATIEEGQHLLSILYLNLLCPPLATTTSDPIQWPGLSWTKDRVTQWVTQWVTHWVTYWVTRWVTRWVTHWITHWVTHWVTHWDTLAWFSHTDLYILSLVRSLKFIIKVINKKIWTLKISLLTGYDLFWHDLLRTLVTYLYDCKYMASWKEVWAV